MRYLNYIFSSIIGTLLLCTPFAIDDSLANGIVMGKVFWIQLLLFIFSIGTLFFSIVSTRKYFSFNWTDMWILLIGGWGIFNYQWEYHPEPEKLLLGGQMIVLWFILRQTLNCYPELKNYYLYVLLGSGFIEAIWGIRQLHGLDISNHSLFCLTGTFFNPGPYSGYLAVILPICVGIYLKQPTRNLIYYFSGICALAILVVLPAGMSRSAWVAATVAGCWLYCVCRIDYVQLKKSWTKHKKSYTLLAFIGCILLLGSAFYLYKLKKESADGRLLMWKITTSAIEKQLVFGTGLGGFPAAYAEAQAEYMNSDKVSSQEKLVAGCPEYAFNEFLQIGVEFGIIGLGLFLAWIIALFYYGIKQQEHACCAGIMSLAIFCVSSYPLQLPDFWVVIVFLGTICVTSSPRKNDEVGGKTYYMKQICSFMFMTGIVAAGIGLFEVQQKYYQGYQQWNHVKTLYQNKAYEAALDGYLELYPLLNHKPEYLFEAAQCLSQTGQYAKANGYLERAVKLSADPMLYYVMAKNEQALGQYGMAETHLRYAINILPERIYPYYLLANLYAEPNYYQPAKLKEAIDSVLTKKPKVMSTAIKEMRDKVEKMLKNTE